jgi:hypothetical protein
MVIQYVKSQQLQLGAAVDSTKSADSGSAMTKDSSMAKK